MKAMVSKAAVLLGALTAIPAAGAHSLLDYVGQCVPFARQASGIAIYGDAWTWWSKAEGKYPRGRTPRVGAVVVFEKTSRLPLGHVAVVSRVVEDRVLMLTHANWSIQNGQRGHAEQDVTLHDVSPANDWSQVKVWYGDRGGLGSSVYPVDGFIYGDGHAAAGLSGRQPDDVGALIDAYVPEAATATR
jgi:surface antigen